MDRWTKRLQQLVKGCEFYGPNDLGNPAPGMWAVRGPTSEMRHSSYSIDHAAILYLVQVCRDHEAKVAIGNYKPSASTPNG